MDKRAREEAMRENLMLTAHCRIIYSRKYFKEAVHYRLILTVFSGVPRRVTEQDKTQKCSLEDIKQIE